VTVFINRNPGYMREVRGRERKRVRARLLYADQTWTAAVKINGGHVRPTGCDRIGQAAAAWMEEGEWVSMGG